MRIFASGNLPVGGQLFCTNFVPQCARISEVSLRKLTACLLESASVRMLHESGYTTCLHESDAPVRSLILHLLKFSIINGLYVPSRFTTNVLVEKEMVEVVVELLMVLAPAVLDLVLDTFS